MAHSKFLCDQLPTSMIFSREELPAFLHHCEHSSIRWQRSHHTRQVSTVESPPSTFFEIQFLGAVNNVSEFAFFLVRTIRLHGGFDDVSGVCEDPVHEATCAASEQMNAVRQVTTAAALGDEVVARAFEDAWNCKVILFQTFLYILRTGN